jgi:hypothetical protein
LGLRGKRHTGEQGGGEHGLLQSRHVSPSSDAAMSPI